MGKTKIMEIKQGNDNPISIGETLLQDMETAIYLCDNVDKDKMGGQIETFNDRELQGCELQMKTLKVWPFHYLHAPKGSSFHFLKSISFLLYVLSGMG